MEAGSRLWLGDCDALLILPFSVHDCRQPSVARTLPTTTTLTTIDLVNGLEPLHVASCSASWRVSHKQGSYPRVLGRPVEGMVVGGCFDRKWGVRGGVLLVGGRVGQGSVFCSGGLAHVRIACFVEGLAVVVCQGCKIKVLNVTERLRYGPKMVAVGVFLVHNGLWP